MKNAFQLPPSFKSSSSLPPQEPTVLPLFLGLPQKTSKPLTKALNVLDTQTTDGLSVHLQSPALKRRYWQRQHIKEYEQLKRLALHGDWIRQTLEARGCHSLKTCFDRDMLHLEQLQMMYDRLKNQEEKGLTAFEQWLFQQEKQIHTFFKRIFSRLEDPLQGMMNGSENSTDIQGQRLLQQWIFRLCQRYKEKGLSPDLVQDVYTLQQRRYTN